MIGIIDYGSSNIASICNVMKYLNEEYHLITDGKKIKDFTKLILPGVGSFKFAMKSLQERDMIEPIKNILNQKDQSILGICLGMQLFYSWSEEDGGCKGMNLIEGEVLKINSNDLPVPNTGWRECKIINNNDILFKNISNDTPFYFVHSYRCVAKNQENVSSKIIYGVPIDASFNYQNLYGTQFHPEKSQKVGLQLLSNFLTKNE